MATVDLEGQEAAGHARPLQTDGFFVLRQVLRSDEIARLRRQTSEALDQVGIPKRGGTVLPNAAAEAPAMSWIFHHPRLLTALREACGEDALIFTMEADLHRNYPASNWHKDSGEQALEGGYFDCISTARDDCKVYKVAIYLQDQKAEQALQVRPGSIRTADLAAGSGASVDVRAGDAILFDVRLTHRGVRPPLPIRGLSYLSDRLNRTVLTAGLARFNRVRNRVSRRGDRLAIYFAFGAANERSAIFAKRNMGRQLDQLTRAGRDRRSLPGDLVREFAAANVATVDID